MKQMSSNVKKESISTEEQILKALNASKKKKSKVVMLSLNNTLVTVFYDSYKVVDEELIFQINGRDSCIVPVVDEIEISETVMGTLMIKYL